MGEKSLKSAIGKRLQEVRKGVGVTQAELAARLRERLGGDTHSQTISDWERGESNISLGTLEDIADILGVNPVALVTLDSDDYRAAMQEAATIVEGELRDLVKVLRERGEPPETEIEPVSRSNGGAADPDDEEDAGGN